MRDILSEVIDWHNSGNAIALARVVRVEGSAPRAPGAAMVVNADGRVAGSVSGGCVEGAVVSEALGVIADGRPRLVRFGYSDDEGFAIGLTCGGIIDIFVAPAPLAVHDSLETALRAGQPVVLATVLSIASTELAEPGADFSCQPDGPHANDEPAVVGACMMLHEDGRFEGSLGNAGLERSVLHDAAGALATGRNALRCYGPSGEARGEDVSVFFEAFASPPEMVIFGAVDFAAALSYAAKFLGYTVTVCDARATFATQERFPSADDVVVDWPNHYLEKVGANLGPRDAVCVLTHDQKFDVPAVVSALSTKVGYIGTMGSRRTNERRRAKLLEAGVSEEQLNRVMGPIGLDIGAATPEETAIAICAEIIALRNKRTPTSLRDSANPIHATFDLTEAAGA